MPRLEATGANREVTDEPPSKRMRPVTGQYRVLLCEGVHANAVNLLEKEGFIVETEKKALSEEELLARLPHVHAVGVRSKTQLSKKVLKAAEKLLCTGNFCIGTDAVNLKFAENQGVPAFNAPFSNTRSVAELVISHCIALNRKVGDVSRMMHEGTWNKSAKGCFEVRGKTIGVVGYGHVGSQVSILAEAFGMSVLFYDPVSVMPMGNALQCDTLEELLTKSDMVTLHVPKTEDTHNMIAASELAKMKKGAVLINYARGTVVDIEALAVVLRSGHLGGAAIDVFPTEPAANGKGMFESCLIGCPNTILTPHIGGSTQEAQALIGSEVALKIISYLKHGDTSTSVNFPQLKPPPPSILKHRQVIINVHRNVPGVLSQINGILSSVNVLGQHLRTTADIGYLAVEVDATDVDITATIKDIDALEASIRTRQITDTE